MSNTNRMVPNRELNRMLNLPQLAADYRLLESIRCRCEMPKIIGEPFCRECWSVLSPKYQRALETARPALTFTVAYRSATQYLDRRSHASEKSN
jgi:hypothetical protein